MNKVINHVPQILFEDLKSAENEKYWDKVEKSHILITGGTGFIAYYLIMTLLCMNDVKNCANTITILVRNEEKARQKFGSLLDRPDFRVLKQDVCLPVVDSVRYDYIIHAASSADAKHFESEPIGVFNANVLGTQNMLALAKEHSCKSMVYISSFTVYGAANDVAKISEDYCGVEPWNNIRSCYSYGKRSSEFLCFAAHRTEDVPVRIVRPGFVYGASAPDDPRVYAEIIRCLAKHQEIVLQSAGHLYRSMM